MPGLLSSCVQHAQRKTYYVAGENLSAWHQAKSTIFAILDRQRGFDSGVTSPLPRDIFPFVPTCFPSPARCGQHDKARGHHRGRVHSVPHADDAALDRGFGYRGRRHPSVLIGQGALRQEEVERRSRGQRSGKIPRKNFNS